jgi:signal transduction histidine kinase
VKTTAKVTRLVGFAIVVITIAIAGIGFFVARGDIDRMREAGKENIIWGALQVEIELMRFQRALAEFSGGSPDVTSRTVNDRYDILWSRLSLFQEGTVGARLRAYDDQTAAISGLFAKVREVEPRIIGLSADDRASILTLQAEFNPFASRLRSLSREVLHGEEQIMATLREDLSRSSTILTFISAAAVLASLAMLVVFAREARQFRDLAATNERLLKISDKANRAKSQFLAMMSHELRTPMNGVLGLLALVRQLGMTGQQARLMDQAERSGQQMIGLLGDILDFSSLQDGRLTLENKPFEPTQLAAAVQDMFQPVASREGIEFIARVDATCPDRVLGDFARLRQALTHLATYLLETAGTRNIELDISYLDDCLNAAISFDYSQAGGEWTPELIMGKGGQDSDSFASEALGPAVSRGLIERMGGSTKLFNPSETRIAVLVSVPAKELVVDTLLVLVACQSTALEAICKASLRGENIRFIGPDSELAPHVVMIEAGGAIEAGRLDHYAKTYPQAFLVALGRPQNQVAFDDTVEVPIDIATIREAGFMQLARRTAPLAGEDKLRYAENAKTT